MQSVEELIDDKVLEADEDEYAYLSAILGGGKEDGSITQHSQRTTSSASAMHILSRTGPAVKPTNDLHEARPDLATQKRMIRAIHDIFPTYSADFLDACFQNIGWQLEAVTNALLSDSLPDSLQQMKVDRAESLLIAPPAPSVALMASYGAFHVVCACK